MSKFSKYGNKPKWKPKAGSLVVSSASILIEIGEIKEIHGEKWAQISSETMVLDVPIRDIIALIREKTWRIVKDGPIEPEKILKEFKFI